MRQSKTCGEPCAVCDGCLEAHDAETVKGFASVIAQQAARVADLEEALLEIDDWLTGKNNIEDDEEWEADEVLRRRVRAVVKQALAGRKDG